MKDTYYYVRKDKHGNIVSSGSYGSIASFTVYGDERDIAFLRLMDEQDGSAQEWRETTLEIVSEDIVLSRARKTSTTKKSFQKRKKKRRK